MGLKKSVQWDVLLKKLSKNTWPREKLFGGSVALSFHIPQAGG